MNKRTWSIVLMLLLLVLTAAAVLSGRNGKYLDEPYEKEKVALDTLVSIKVYGEENRQVEQAVDLAIKEIEKVDKETDYYDPRSDISQLNKNAANNSNTPVPASAHLVEIISTCKELSRLSGGAFDLTLGPVIELWNFGGKGRVPSAHRLGNALALADMGGLKVDRKKSTVLFRRLHMQLDLGGVAKGYAADRAVDILKRKGIDSALVTTGSTTVVLGAKPDGKPWLVGIQHPRKEGKTLGTLELTNENVSTSGDYQRYFVRNGKRYHHILDPKTGLPANRCRSVTIVTKKSCTEADILSTAVFVMGASKGLDLLETLADTEGIIVDSRGKVHVTAGLEPRLSMSDE